MTKADNQPPSPLPVQSDSQVDKLIIIEEGLEVINQALDKHEASFSRMVQAYMQVFDQPARKKKVKLAPTTQPAIAALLPTPADTLALVAKDQLTTETPPPTQQPSTPTPGQPLPDTLPTQLPTRLKPGRPKDKAYDDAFNALYIQSLHAGRREAFNTIVLPVLGRLDPMLSKAAYEAFEAAMNRRLRKYRRNTDENTNN